MYNYYEPDYEPMFEGLTENELDAVRHVWNELLDWSYSPFTPNQEEIHGCFKRLGKLLGEMPPEVLPFSGTQEI